MSSEPIKTVVRGPRGAWSPYFVLWLSLAITVGVSWYVEYTSDAREQQRFRSEQRALARRIGERMEDYAQVLRDTAGLFAADPNISVDRFHQYAATIDVTNRYPGSVGIGYARRIVAGDKEKGLEMIRGEGVLSYSAEIPWIGTIPAPFRVTPAGDREEYYPIVLREPMDLRNKLTIGFDVWSEPARRAAMEQARDSAEAVTTSRVHLLYDFGVDEQTGVVMVLPVYEGGVAPGTVEERRAKVLGFVISPIRANDMISAVDPDSSTQLNQLDFALYDGEAGTGGAKGTLLHRSRGSESEGAEESARGYHDSMSIAVPGRTWTLEVFTNSQYSGTPERMLSWGMLGVGLGVSVLLFTVTSLLSKSRVKAERIAGSLRAREGEIRRGEERYRSLVSATSQIVWSTDAYGEVVEDLPTWRAFTGQSYAEMAGRGWVNAIHPEDVKGVGEVWESSLATNLPHEQEYRVKGVDGTYRKMVARAAPVFEADGTVREWIGTCSDVTEKRRSEWSIRFLVEASSVLGSTLAYETTLADLGRLIVPGLADWYAVDMVGEDGEIRRLATAHGDPEKLRLTEEWRTKFPIDRAAERGTPFVIRTGESEFHPEVTQEMIEQSVREPEQLRILKEIGVRSVIIVPLAARDRTLGAITLVSAESGHQFTGADLALAQELARRAGIAVDNARLYREAQQANQMKDDFLATVSHELRTPLNAMLGWSQMLQGGTLDEETTHEAVEAIERNAKAQAKLIEDLLDLSRIIRGKIQMDVRSVDMGGVVDAAIAAVLPGARAKQVAIVREGNGRTMRVMGDATRLQQITWNLLANAVKFTPEGGRVEVRIERQRGKLAHGLVRVEVKDTGRGIAAGFLPFVFDRFRQADASTTRRSGGLGLGLAIVRHLAELHGGTVDAQSLGEGRGATFGFSIPAADPETEELVEEKKEEGAAGLSGEKPLAGVKVLVVDDELDSRRLVATILERQGAVVTAAGSVREAMEVMEAFRPDVLLSDISMPEEDGYDLIRAIREGEGEGRHVPAAALTAFARTDDRLKVLAAGFQVHVAKPVEAAELLATVAGLAGAGVGSRK